MTTLVLSLGMALLLIGGVIFLIKFGKKSGENAILRKSLEEEVDDASNARDIDVEVDKLTDAEKRKWLKEQSL